MAIQNLTLGHLMAKKNIHYAPGTKIAKFGRYNSQDSMTIFFGSELGLKYGKKGGFIVFEFNSKWIALRRTMYKTILVELCIVHGKLNIKPFC